MPTTNVKNKKQNKKHKFFEINISNSMPNKNRTNLWKANRL